MIELSFNISLPADINFKNIWSRVWATPFKHKFIELELYAKHDTLLEFSFRWTTRQDHAGINLQLCLLGYCFGFNFYDNRHWDYSTGKWITNESKDLT